MFGIVQNASRTLARLTGDPSQLHRRLRIVGVSVAVILAGSILASGAQRIDSRERIDIGDTGGTLAILINLKDARIMVGAGASRSHAADFLGRSTRPWNREIDLLVIPGWDDHHATGALGLLERESVVAIAVIGLPGDDPIWTLLDRAAEAADVPIRYLDRPHRLSITDGTVLRISSVQSNNEGVWVRLKHHHKRFDMIDAESPADALPDPRAFAPGNNHVLINMRNQHQPIRTDPQLLITPDPQWGHEFSDASAPFHAGVARNERLSLRLDDEVIRIGLEAVESR